MAIEYKDYYKILGVPKTSTDKEIKAAYRKLARQYHPDVNPGDAAAENKFKEVGEAYEVLSDDKKRAQYDRFGDQWKAYSQGGGARPAGPGAGAGATPGGVEFDFGGFGAGGIEDFLSSLFGGQAGPAQSGYGGFTSTHKTRGRARSSHDMEYPVEISLEEAYRGTTTSFVVTVPEMCDICHGVGTVVSSSRKPCPVCEGTGRTKSGRSLFGGNVCPRCKGTGQMVETCPSCQGAGTTEQERRISDIKIPPGVADGQKIRLAGQGANGGDLYMRIKVRPNPKFERDGDDLKTEFAVPYTVAALGGEAVVDTLSGRKLLTIPPGTQGGQSFRLTGLGMPKLKEKGSSGNLYARSRITIPTNPTSRERELLQELEKLRKAG
jgi:molecular chaperone DnaJ